MDGWMEGGRDGGMEGWRDGGRDAGVIRDGQGERSSELPALSSPPAADVMESLAKARSSTGQRWTTRGPGKGLGKAKSTAFWMLSTY